MNNVFENLGEDKAYKLYRQFKKQGKTSDEAFTEVYAIECNIDKEGEE